MLHINPFDNMVYPSSLETKFPLPSVLSFPKLISYLKSGKIDYKNVGEVKIQDASTKFYFKSKPIDNINIAINYDYFSPTVNSYYTVTSHNGVDWHEI